MKKEKIKHTCLSGIIFIVINIVAKFLIYGNNTIWLNYMPVLPAGKLSLERKLPPRIAIFRYSIYKMIPFIIINICVIGIYTLKMYNKKIYNKKTDIIFPIIMLFIVLILIYFLISMQYSICE